MMVAVLTALMKIGNHIIDTKRVLVQKITFPYRPGTKLYGICNTCTSTLSWKWCHNEVVMMRQNGFVSKFPKSVTLDNIFDFVVSESCEKVCCMPTTWDCWSCLFYSLFYIFTIVLNLLIPTKNTEHNPQLPLVPLSLVRRSHKKSATTATMTADAASHYGCNFSHNSPYWPLWLHQWVLPPSNNCGLFDCCQQQGDSYLASCTSLGTVQTMQKLKNNI